MQATAESRRRAAVELIKTKDRVFRRTARRYSLCADDSEDAYQRALEILLTKAPPITGDALIRWMQTVTKREAMAVRRQRERLLSAAPRGIDGEDRDPLDLIPSEAPGPTDRAERHERVTRSNEALRALKPQEVRALTLKAEGYSYAEIGEITGWSYTKINRCMAEGRKRFLQVFAEIEAGRRCKAIAPALSAIADGEQSESRAGEVEIHLRSCAACRATLRAFREVPDQILQLMPIGPALDVMAGGRAHEWFADRLGAAAERIASGADRARDAGYSFLHRCGVGGGDAGPQLAAVGGSRGAGVAGLGKLLAICGATAAGGATCVATGVVDPVAAGIGSNERPAIERSDQTVTESVEVVKQTTPEQSAEPPEVQQVAEKTTEVAPQPPAQSQFEFESSADTSTSSSAATSLPRRLEVEAVLVGAVAAAGSGSSDDSPLEGSGDGWDRRFGEGREEAAFAIGWVHGRGSRT